MLTAATTDEDINGEGPGSLTNAVIQVEKTLKKSKCRKPTSAQARDLLIQMADEPGDASLTKKPAFLVPNPVNEIDLTTQQNPGVPVTPEEQKLADSGVSEYTLQVELNIRNGTNDLAVFQQFVNRCIGGDNKTEFLPWYNNDKETMPVITRHNSPFQVIRGEVRLQNFLGPCNRNKSCLYGRVKVQMLKSFDEIKQRVVEWLRQ